MTPLGRARLLCLLLVALMVAMVPSAGLAAPLEVRRDRTDNGFSFSYDAAQGKITGAASSIRVERDDPVLFVISVTENPVSDSPGERLRARLSIELNKERVVRYDGIFSFDVVDSSGMVIFSDSAERSFVLKPRQGSRKARVRFVFDLPSGSYETIGRFARAGR